MIRRASTLSSSSSAWRKRRNRPIEEVAYDHYSQASGSQSPYQTGEDDEEESDYEASMDRRPTDPDAFIHNRPSYTASPPPPRSALHAAPTDQPSKSYVNVAPLPIFRGVRDESPISHLSRFVKVCRANNAPSMEAMARIFPATLLDEALLWYDFNVDPYHHLTWEEIKSSFVEAYSKADFPDDLRSELMTINQGEEEPVRSYFLRLQWILKRRPDHGLSEGLIKEVFVDGLGRDFQDWITPRKPGSLKEALRLAFDWEQLRQIRGDGRSEASCEFCSGPHREADCEIREMMRQKWLKEKGTQSRGLVPEIGEDGASVRSGSAGRNRSAGNGGGRDGEMEMEAAGGGEMKKQCHRCGKKMERSGSVLSAADSKAARSSRFDFSFRKLFDGAT